MPIMKIVRPFSGAFPLSESPSVGILGDDNYRMAPEAPLRRGPACEGDKACP
jgi:hypothetical protein